MTAAVTKIDGLFFIVVSLSSCFVILFASLFEVNLFKLWQENSGALLGVHPILEFGRHVGGTVFSANERLWYFHCNHWSGSCVWPVGWIRPTQSLPPFVLAVFVRRVRSVSFTCGRIVPGRWLHILVRGPRRIHLFSVLVSGLRPGWLPDGRRWIALKPGSRLVFRSAGNEFACPALRTIFFW